MNGLKSGRGGEYANGNGVSLLLLGPAQSGKSTFFRQLQLMHGKCFTTLQEKITFRPIINENLLGSLHTLVTKMPMFQIALSHKGSEKVKINLWISILMSSSLFILKREIINNT